MSTLLSTDMHIKRSTTRLHAPPGGLTTINLGGGDYEPATPTRRVQASQSVAAPAQAPSAAVSVEEITVDLKAATISPVTVAGNVVVVIAGNPAGTDAVHVAIAKGLLSNGIPVENVKYSEVEDVTILPFIVKKIAKEHSFEVIVAVAVFTGDSSLSSPLVSNLIQLGMESGTPIVPGVLACSSLLETKALASTYASSWARSAAALLSRKEIQFSASPAVPVKAPFTASTTSIDELLDNFRESLKAHGARGIFGIGRLFRIADDDNSGKLSLAEFSKVVNEHAMHWTPAQVQTVYDYFDKDKTQSGIDYNEFLVGVRGGLNERRHQLVLQAFQILDTDSSGEVTVEEIKGRYNAKKHPEVIAGRRTEDDVLREFLETFEGHDKSGKLTQAGFCEYYSSLSASIDLDDYFELMIRNAWHISGGEGWCANSSCRRVLAVHSDGRQTVEEIKNDLGIGPTDIEAMKANLVKQGITDVVSISLTASVDSTDPPAAPPSPTKAAAGVRKPTGVASEQVRPSTAPSNPRRAPGGASTLVLG